MKHIINSTTKNGESIKIEIRLDDECKNGHDDFAITSTTWEKGKPKNDRYCTGGGCQHNTILESFPELKIFVDLHLSTSEGVPMYAIENGFYHLKNSDQEIARNYIRATEKEMETINHAEDQLHYQYLLELLGIPQRWKETANKAIAMLEEMTGEKYVDSTTRKTFTPLGAKMKEIEKKVKSGFYTTQAIAERANEKQKAKIAKEIAEVKAATKKEIYKAKVDLSIQLQIIPLGVSRWAFIYHSHTNEVVFNWHKSTDNITSEKFAEIMEKIDRKKLPKAVTFKLGKR